MALKALDIFKLLPKTNCKKCGCPTCLAFAMKLTTQKATLDECPDVSEDAKAQLSGAAAPPIRLVAIGAGAAKIEIGGETVMFRHEESFYHPPGIGVVLPDNLDEDDLRARIAAVKALSFVRVGMRIGVTVVGVENVSGDAAAFASTVKAVASLELPMVLIARQAAHAEAALAECAAARPLIHAATDADWQEYVRVAKSAKCPLAVTGPDLDSVAALAVQVRKAGIEDIVLDLGAGSIAAGVEAMTAARRLALKRKADGVGFPCMAVVREPDPYQNVSDCCAYVAKYAGIVLTPLSGPEQIAPILTLSQNLYTDPRKPVQVEAKLYSVGAVTPQSPLLVTTNFSLTYYTVQSEVEASRVPTYIGVIDTEGTSVLTAFAADKLSSEKVAAFLMSAEVSEAVSHRKVIIPGYVAAMSGSLNEDSGWEVLVGPREASALSKYLKTVWQDT
ncbi:MAG: acetyl-CoA decarbonylase/synthase complex subunit gamma [Kiritimatiellaeota bacterium]|nr:acetyl-CoA decarbonylase/synthase complex subunit gamma [Kiritimatiellota bacterium]